MNHSTSTAVVLVGCFAGMAVLAVSPCQAQNYTINTIAGYITPATTPATEVALQGASGLSVDSAGNIYFAEFGNNVVRKVTPRGVISIVAGDINGGGGYYGDGGPAVGAGLRSPSYTAFDTAGNLYIADTGNNRVRKVSTDGTITTVAGGGSSFTLGGQATQVFILMGNGLAVDSSGNIFLTMIVGSGASGQVLKVAPNGIITAVAGDPHRVASLTDIGDGGPATSAFIAPIGLAIDSAGNVYIADATNRIRKFAPGGTINTVAGSNTSNFSGDGGPATSAGLNGPSGVAIDAGGSLYIVDSVNYRLRKVSPDGTITTIAGNGKPEYSGDGGPATSASLKSPGSIALGTGGAIYITDVYDYSALVRMLTPAFAVPQIYTGGVVPVYSSVGTIQPGEWISIFGSNLASETATWKGDFPVSLGGTSITINSKSTYLSYVSPGQVNVQAPDDSATGPVSVVVTTAGGSATSTVTLGQFGPSFSLLDTKHVAGVIVRSDGSGAYGGGTYDIVGPGGTSLGYKTVAAKAGDVLELFGVGFGPTNPAVPAGKLYTGAAPTTNPVQLLINNTPLTPAFSGLTAAGLYQLNVILPGGLGTGDVALQATVGGVKTSSGIVLSLQ